MAVLKKEYYTQLNKVQIIKVILNSTKNKIEVNDYFYCSRNAENLVDAYTWRLERKNGYIGARCSDSIMLNFHKELFKFYNGYVWNGEIDHISHCEFDNTDINLNAVTKGQNNRNKFTRGYLYDKADKSFRSRVCYKDKIYRPYKRVYKEDAVCQEQCYLEQVFLKENLGSEYYAFDFLKYRRGDEDLLDLERTGIISEDEATYRHILRYSGNAWFYLRFRLQDYFASHGIAIPQYKLDKDGFMIHPETGQRLCPF